MKGICVCVSVGNSWLRMHLFQVTWREVFSEEASSAHLVKKLQNWIPVLFFSMCVAVYEN